MASLHSASSVLSSSHAVSGVHTLFHDGVRSRSNSALPLKLSFAGVPLKSTKVGKRVFTPLWGRNDSLCQLYCIPNQTEYWGNARPEYWDSKQFQYEIVNNLNQTTARVGDLSTRKNYKNQSFTKIVRVPERVGPKPRVILIAGPTAVGKTRLSIELAKRLDGEIINADSVQVYQGLDIGAAKAPVAERQGIPHHLIDVVPPTRDYTYTEFLVAARAATEHILAKGKVPIVVGGTGMYMRWYMHNGMYNGRNLTSHPFEGELEVEPDWDYDFQCYFLYQHRADLYPRVDIRCEQMVPALLAETSWLMDLGVAPNSNAAAKAIGYEEAMQLLLDARKNDGYVSQQRFMRFLGDFQRNSKELVRKQIAWFRSESRSEVRQFKWLQAADASVAAMVELLMEEYRMAPEDVSGLSPELFPGFSPGLSPGLSPGQDLKNASRLEQRRLKHYEPALRVYSDPVAVASSLAWIHNTQGVADILANCGWVY